LLPSLPNPPVTPEKARLLNVQAEKGTRETPRLRYGEKKHRETVWKPVLVPQKKCHVDAIVSRFSLKKTKRIYLV